MIINKRAAFFVSILISWLAACSSDPEPDKTGYIPAVDSLIQHEIKAGHIPGAVIQIKKGDAILHRAAYGYAQKYAREMQLLDEPDPMTTDHLFDLASLTKVMATTLGIMLLVDADSIALNDPVQTYLEGFQGPDKAKVTVRHLLTHTSGLPQWVPTYYHASDSEEQSQYITSLPLKWPVGKERHYSDIGFMLLGDIIGQVSGQQLDNYLQKKIYEPLNLQHTTFNPLDKKVEKETIAATSHGNPFEKQMVYDDHFGYEVDVDPESWDGWREYTLRGEVNDGNAWYAREGVAGHAGLFATVDDLQVLVDLLLHEGTFKGKQVISAPVIERFLMKGPHGNGLGWAMEKHIISAEGSPGGTFGHTGFTGTSIVAVPKDTLSVILLTNRQNAGRQDNGYYFDLGPLRQALFDEAVDRY